MVAPAARAPCRWEGSIRSPDESAEGTARHPHDQDDRHPQAADDRLRTLAGKIAHDLGNSLTAILGTVDLTIRTFPEPRTLQDSLRKIEGAARGASELCKQLRAYSGGAGGALELVDLSQWIPETVRDLRAFFPEQAVVETALAPDVPPARANRAQLSQILRHIITNASEAIGDLPGTIRVSTLAVTVDQDFLRAAQPAVVPAPGRYSCIEVADTGVGMDAATRTRIFDPFFTTKPVSRGLGLSAALGMARANRGTIVVDSAPGRGTKVRVLLPVADADSQDRRTVATAVRLGRRLRILVADDDAQVLETLAAILDCLGHATLLARDGEEALAIYRREAETIDVLMLDQIMPGLDGAAVWLAVREQNPEAVAVFACANAEAATAQRLLAHGVAALVAKPYTVESVEKALLLAAARLPR